MGDEDDGDTVSLLDQPHLFLQFLPQQWVERAQGFVQQEDFGIDDERARQGHPLLLAPGKFARLAVFQPVQSHEVHHRGHPALPFRAGQVAQPKANVLHHAHVGKEAIVLGHIAHLARLRLQVDPPPRVQPDLPVHAHEPFLRGEKSGNGAHGEGLPHPAGAEEHHDLRARLKGDVQRHMGEGVAQGDIDHRVAPGNLRLSTRMPAISTSALKVRMATSTLARAWSPACTAS